MESATETVYNTNLASFRKHPRAAVEYVEDTWLSPWKEKLVRYWVDKVLHFGIRVTSLIKGCHAVLKSYLKVSTGDLKGVFNCLLLFWTDQHRNIYNACAIEKNKTKHSLSKVYFHMVQSLVYDKALRIILVECAKLYRLRESSAELVLGPCNCTIKQSMGLPCFHVVHERLLEGGYIFPTDIHPFWWYTRPEATAPSAVNTPGPHPHPHPRPRPPVLNPSVVRGKGRPRGLKNREKGHGVTSTQRDPSQFEYMPSSSAPPVLTRQPTERASARRLLEIHAESNKDSDKEDNEENNEEDNEEDNNEFLDIYTLDTGIDSNSRSTTMLGILRIHKTSDTFCPGTLPP